VGARAACRDHAVIDDAISGVLGPGAFRRIRSSGDGRVRTLRELERPETDLIRYAPAGHLFLGFAGLSR
jgi:hypothetical protein